MELAGGAVCFGGSGEGPTLLEYQRNLRKLDSRKLGNDK